MGDMKAIDNLSGYELGLVGVRTFGKEDKAVSVLVVANADNSLFNDCATYADYTSKTIQTTSFQSSQLVKIGKSNTTLKYNGTNEAIRVLLIQLSAKIEYKGIYNKNNNDLINDQFSLINVEGLNASSQVAIFNTSSVENGVFLFSTGSFFCSESTQSVFSPNSYAHFYSQLFSCIFACFQSYPHCPQFYTHFYDPHNVDFLCITLFT
jgi:uncharacterized membrane protein